jgi:hypothetical protein
MKIQSEDEKISESKSIQNKNLPNFLEVETKISEIREFSESSPACFISESENTNRYN